MRGSTAAACLVLMALLQGCGGMGSGSTEQMPTDDHRDTLETETVADGMFVSKAHETSGSYEISRTGQDLSLALSQDFRSAEGPDLWVILSPVEVEQATNRNVRTDGATVIDSLSSPSGMQTFDLSNSIRVDSLNSVAIYCIEYQALFGIAALE